MPTTTSPGGDNSPNRPTNYDRAAIVVLQSAARNLVYYGNFSEHPRHTLSGVTSYSNTYHQMHIYISPPPQLSPTLSLNDPPPHTHTHIHMHTRTHAQTRTHSHAHRNTHTHTHAHTHTHTQARTVTHAHARTHARTHTQTHRIVCSCKIKKDKKLTKQLLEAVVRLFHLRVRFIRQGFVPENFRPGSRCPPRFCQPETQWSIRSSLWAHLRFYTGTVCNGTCQCILEKNAWISVL